MGVIAHPSAREPFTTRELVALGSTQQLGTPDRDATACIEKCCPLARDPSGAWPQGMRLRSCPAS